MRPVLVLLVGFVAGAVGGIASSSAPSEAHADMAGELVVPVPAQGVVFRGNGGRAMMRVRSGPSSGGMLEVLDVHENLAVRLRTTLSGGIVEFGKSQAPESSPVISVEEPGY